MSKEAMKLALEALKLNNNEWKVLADYGDSGLWRAEDQDHYQKTNKAITALQKALAEQPAQQEPNQKLVSAAVTALEALKKHRQMKGEYPVGMLGVRAVEEIEAAFREIDEAAHNIKENT